MANVLLLVLLSVPWATAGLQSSDHLVKFALLGDSITLPCAKHAPSVRLCSSVNWNMAEQFQSVTEVVKAGRVTSPDRHRLVLLNDCSLQINHLMLNDARLYTCDSGTRNSSVSLQILEINENKRSSVEEIELQCFLNTYKGHGPCNITGIHIKWSTEDSTPIKGNRFRIENPSGCFSKLIIKKKLTDHHRKWKCQLTQNDVVKASISHSTSVFIRSAGSDEITCSVRREDAVMASKRWSHVNPLQTLAWLAVPVSLLTCIAAGGLCLYMKRKRNKDAGHEQSSFRMTHVYEDIQHVNNEELQQQRPCKREAAATDGFYQLLQPVN
ncbi:uncharacterized protein LOC113170208 isoform X3 [Anabas testudineus]|uniref:uncharacterized protein LOC113170208 isoform X3 n=1 Tax=Anabas testudineus TaxID=64144 RepID=UPI000E45B7F4|nr:uncharacterized protein LOC113170208 isoform X3 [Anabas testudineus]